MSEIIPPRRGDFLDARGQPTIRFLNWLESLTTVVNESTESISSVELEDGGNRNYRRYVDEVENLKDDITQIKRANRNLENIVFELGDSLMQFKNKSRLLEQQISELTERYDNGT